MLKNIVIVTIILMFFSEISFSNEEMRMLDKNRALFELKDMSIVEVICEISREYKAPVCVETIPQTWEELEKEKFSFKLKNTILSNVLDAIVKKDKRYIWIDNNNVINIIPKTLKEDSNYILNQRISRFVVKDGTESDALGTFLLLPEIRKSNLSIMERGRLMSMDTGLRLRTHTFNIDLQNVTLREILNAIVKAEGNAHWILMNIKTDKGLEHNLDFGYWEVNNSSVP